MTEIERIIDKMSGSELQLWWEKNGVLTRSQIARLNAWRKAQNLPPDQSKPNPIVVADRMAVLVREVCGGTRGNRREKPTPATIAKDKLRRVLEQYEELRQERTTTGFLRESA
jgi:hypothetical protein